VPFAWQVNLNVGQCVSPARFSAGNPLGRRDALPYVDALRRGVQTYIAQQSISPQRPLDATLRRQSLALHVRGLTSGAQYWFQVSAITPPAPAPGATPLPNGRPEQNARFPGRG
jgi:hypothetical protein